MKKYQSFVSEKFQFLEVKFSIHLNRRVFVMSFLFRKKPFQKGLGVQEHTQVDTKAASFVNSGDKSIRSNKPLQERRV